MPGRVYNSLVRNVIQREIWNGNPEQLRELFSLAKAGRAMAVCSLWSHQLGWELRLAVNGSLVRSQVMRSAESIDSTAEDWRSVMLAEGWTANPL